MYINKYVDTNKKWKFLPYKNVVEDNDNDNDNDKDWNIKCSSPYLIYTDDEVHSIWLLPSYNQLNSPEKRLQMLFNNHLFSISKKPIVCGKKIRTFVVSLENDPFEVIINIDPLNDCKIYKSYLENERKSHIEKLWEFYKWAEKTQDNPIDYLVKELSDKKYNYNTTQLYQYWKTLQEDDENTLQYHDFVRDYTNKWNKRVNLKFKSWIKSL
jgi:hypothetical protein